MFKEFTHAESNTKVLINLDRVEIFAKADEIVHVRIGGESGTIKISYDELKKMLTQMNLLY